MLAAAVDIYRRTRKPNDILWNRLVARPLAAVMVAVLAPTNITPNQVTFLTLPVFLAGAALFIWVPSWGGLIAGAAVMGVAYVLDAAAGARAGVQGHSP